MRPSPGRLTAWNVSKYGKKHHDGLRSYLRTINSVVLVQQVEQRASAFAYPPGTRFSCCATSAARRSRTPRARSAHAGRYRPGLWRNRKRGASWTVRRKIRSSALVSEDPLTRQVMFTRKSNPNAKDRENGSYRLFSRSQAH